MMKKYPAPLEQPKAPEAKTMPQVIELPAMDSVAGALILSARAQTDAANNLQALIGQLSAEKSGAIHVKIIRDSRNMMSELVITRAGK